jgi:hypothetical protein
MNTRLHDRELTAVHDCDKPSDEVLHLIAKLRWMGMDLEAEQLQTRLREATPTGAVIATIQETD